MSSLASSSWGSGPLIVACHGFTQTASSWGRFGELLGEQHTILAVDLPGHGRSGDQRATLTEAAALVVASAGGQAFDLLGYSMGARVALTAALERPAGLGRLVLISGTPGISDSAARRTRRERDESLAAEIESEGDVEAFLGRWLRQPMFGTLATDGAELTSRLANTPAGLASSLRSMGTGTQRPLWGELGSLETPTLCVAGTTDTRFVDLNLKMAAAMANATLSLVQGARHACHLEQPVLCARAVSTWLDA